MLGIPVVVGGRAGIVIDTDGDDVEVLTFAPGGGAPAAVRVPADDVRPAGEAAAPNVVADGS